ncbi:hypothetical protein N9Y90_01885 [Flavobacteriales bacterium]|nr:hypothetical protein [Flavobacteriales bacterium]
MKHLIFFTLISLQAFTQSQFDYMGFLFIENARPISYRIIFDDDNGVLNGYSITGIGTNFETKSEISGTISKKKLALKEFQIISTISEEPISNFCFVDLEANRKGKKTYEGSFKGYYLNGEVCASGKIIISEKAKLEKQIAKVQKIQEIITKRSDNRLIVLKSGDEHTIDWTNNKFKMQMWDSAIEDNDRMTVIINGEKVLSNYSMKNKKKSITYKLMKGENTVQIIAENEGDIVNNTTRIELIDKDNKHAILSELQVGKKITLKLMH